MVSDKFRQQLRDEANQWLADSLINEGQYQRLSERYQFDQLDTVARDRFILVLLGLGSVLLGLGVITFVAANWQVIPRDLRVLMLMALFIGVNAAGFYLWRQPLRLPRDRQRGRQRLGQGLLILGALILGSNMALMGQLFHQSGSAYGLYLVWGFGVVAMAYSLRLVSLSVLGIGLVGIGYWTGVQGFSPYVLPPVLDLLVRYMPIVVAVLFIPLAYWCRSRVVFALSAIALVSSFLVSVTDTGRYLNDAPGLVVAIAFALPPAFLWSYDDALWWQLLRQPTPSPATISPFRPVARNLALIYLGSLLYVMSFHGSWGLSSSVLVPLSDQISRLWTTGLLLNLNLILLVVATVLQWGYGAGLGRRTRGRLDQIDSAILGIVVLMAVVACWHWSLQPIMVVATFAYNALLFVLAAGFLREGLSDGRRNLFWSGMILLTLQILSRTLEYETGLLLKSLVFVLCGIGVITIGLWFERYVRLLSRSSTRSSIASEELP